MPPIERLAHAIANCALERAERFCAGGLQGELTELTLVELVRHGRTGWGHAGTDADGLLSSRLSHAAVTQLCTHSVDRLWVSLCGMRVGG